MKTSSQQRAASECRNPCHAGFTVATSMRMFIFQLDRLAEDARPSRVAGSQALFSRLKPREKTAGLNPQEDSLNDGPSCPAFSLPGAIAGFRVNIDNNFPANEAGVANLAV